MKHSSKIVVDETFLNFHRISLSVNPYNGLLEIGLYHKETVKYLQDLDLSKFMNKKLNQSDLHAIMSEIYCHIVKKYTEEVQGSFRNYRKNDW